MNDIEALLKLQAYRLQKARFPAGSSIRFTRNPPHDLGPNIAIVDRPTALNAVVVAYINSDATPSQTVVAISDITLCEQNKASLPNFADH